MTHPFDRTIVIVAADHFPITGLLTHAVQLRVDVAFSAALAAVHVAVGIQVAYFGNLPPVLLRLVLVFILVLLILFIFSPTLDTSTTISVAAVPIANGWSSIGTS